MEEKIPSIIDFEKNIEIKKIETGKNYSLKFMPNYFDPQTKTETLVVAYKNGSPNKSDRQFVYVYENDKISIYMISFTIVNMIKHCIQGYYGTPEGHFITNDEYIKSEEDRAKENRKKFKFTKYFANADKSTITIDPEYAKNMKFLEYTDFVKYGSRNPFDIPSDLFLEFDTTTERNLYVKMNRIRWSVGIPIWKESDGKEKIINLYNQVATLSEAKESYKLSCLKKDDKYLFDDEARIYCGEQFKKRLNNGKK